MGGGGEKKKKEMDRTQRVSSYFLLQDGNILKPVMQQRARAQHLCPVRRHMAQGDNLDYAYFYHSFKNSWA